MATRISILIKLSH